LRSGRLGNKAAFFHETSPFLCFNELILGFFDKTSQTLLIKGHSRMKARVTVTLKNGVLDPQGKAIEGALKALGVDGIKSVRQGKVFDIELSTKDAVKAEEALRQAGEKLLANTVIENFKVEIND
jgi:phosphoribosylformylglycinamidine synthase